MKVKYSMIDKEYRIRGILLSLLGSKMSEKKIIKLNNKMSKDKGSNIDNVDCAEVYIPTRTIGHHIRVRIYKPVNASENLPGVLYLHGGGYYLCVPENEHIAIEKLLAQRDCVIIAPDYRRSIDAAYPAAIHDCYDTFEWMMSNWKTLGFNKNQVFTIGGSAGGGLVAALNLMVRDMSKFNIAFQMPLFPMIDDKMKTTSMIENNAPIWNEKTNKFAWSLYLRDIAEDQVTSYAAPARNKDFTGLPPTVSYVGSLDPFLDETREFIENINKAGGEARMKVIEGVFHAFEMIKQDSKKAKEAFAYFEKEFSYAVDHYFAENENG